MISSDQRTHRSRSVFIIGAVNNSTVCKNSVLVNTKSIRWPENNIDNSIWWENQMGRKIIAYFSQTAKTEQNVLSKVSMFLWPAYER